MTIKFLKILLIFTLIGCKNTNQKTSSEAEKKIESTYLQTIFPQDTTKLWVTDGNIKSDTTLIICQGGPSRQLTFIEKGRTSYRYIPSYSNYNIVYLHQAQTYNPEIFNFKSTFSIEMANKEVDNSSEMLYRAIKHFKIKNKTVIVIGTSYGAYIIQNYISTRPSIADKYYVLAGRIDGNSEMVEQHLNGFNGGFKEDGISYVSEKENVDLSEYSKEDLKEYRVKQLLKGAIGKPIYSRELLNKDLSNVTYFYAANDQNVGKLSDSEISFLESKGAKVLKTFDGHSEVLYRFIDKLRDGNLNFIE